MGVAIFLLGLGILLGNIGNSDGMAAGALWMLIGFLPFILGFAFLLMKNADIRELRKKQEQQLSEIEIKKKLLVEELHRQEAIISPINLQPHS